MIWIVSKELVDSKEELKSRHQFIQEIAQAKVSPWSEYHCKNIYYPYASFEFYQCISKKGEYGIIITAHMVTEVQAILQQVLLRKRARVVINSCKINRNVQNECLRIITSKNPRSEMYFAKQEMIDSGELINYMDNVGAFGFKTTLSERELFQQRQLGLVKAIRMVYDKVALE